MYILIINSGSSSLKFQFVNPRTRDVKAKGLVDRIGIHGSSVRYTAFKNGEKISEHIEAPIPDHQTGMRMVVKLLTGPKTGVIKNPDDITAVGHRAVHGGNKLIAPTLVTDEVVKLLETMTPLSPVHNPGHLAGLKVSRDIFNKAAHVLVLDTAFHQTMPPKAYRYAIPEKYYKQYGVRAYGFHGTSHKYVYQTARAFLKKDDLKAITIHLGNGSSMAAIDERGQVIDTSMGLTPLDGLVMGTRCGNIDPSVVFFMGEVLNMSFADIKNVLNKESGMLGLAGSSDARDVAELYHQGDANAVLCYEMYAYRIRKFIGAYSVALNGADALIFTAGLGENDSLMRALVCENLSFLGIRLDAAKNEALNRPKAPVEIQVEGSKKILIVPTDEELQIAIEVDELLSKS